MPSAEIVARPNTDELAPRRARRRGRGHRRERFTIAKLSSSLTRSAPSITARCKFSGFDVVLAVTVLCLVSDTRIVAREMARVLAPGGRLVIGELGRYSVWAAERRVRGWLGARTWRHARFWSRRALMGLVEDAGLHVAAVRGSIFFPPSGAVARVVSPFEPLLTRLHAPGAAFLVVAGDRLG